MTSLRDAKTENASCYKLYGQVSNLKAPEIEMGQTSKQVEMTVRLKLTFSKL